MLQVTLRTTDNIPANYVTNQFALTGELGVPTDCDAARDALEVFYTALRANVLGIPIAGTGHIVKAYDLPGLTPNYPYYESTFDLDSVPTSAGLPGEVALCLSFQGARSAGLDQARRRGRIYLGILAAGVNSVGRPSSAALTTVTNAAVALYDDLDAIASAGSWAVWSPTNGDAVPLTDCWVDNAFDTQRSRGVPASSRTVASFI